MARCACSARHQVGNTRHQVGNSEAEVSDKRRERAALGGRSSRCSDVEQAENWGDQAALGWSSRQEFTAGLALAPGLALALALELGLAAAELLFTCA